MGQSESKPAPSSTEHVFTATTPIRFSQDLIDSLQASPETDSTRASDLELHIQSRVTAELKRLESETDTAIKKLEDDLSAAAPTPSKQSSSTISAPDLGRQSVQKEIETLRKRLRERKLREDVVNDKAVESARDDVINCLRINDRRPLDCWKEVEEFKREVGRLEGDYLGRRMR